MVIQYVGMVYYQNSIENNVNNIISESSKFRLTYLFTNQEIGVADNRINLVDTKITWGKDITLNPENIAREEYDGSTHSYDELLYLAYLSGAYSRFRLDRNFQNNEFEKLYKVWLDKSIKGKFDDKIFIKSNKRKLEV
ncbi:MAG: hypothetical protein U5R06_03805 [candidate division KSB1 bacterium]|nr:hypothetical protein [candidate division KSB1 bacterium]